MIAASNPARSTNHKQQSETVATSMRSNVGSAKPQRRVFQMDHNGETSNTISLRLLRTHFANRNRTRGGERNGVQCWRGHRVTPPELASHFVCPLFASPFFDTLARVRRLDPRRSTTLQPQGCVRCKTEPTVELSVGLEKQISTHS